MICKKCLANTLKKNQLAKNITDKKTDRSLLMVL